MNNDWVSVSIINDVKAVKESFMFLTGNGSSAPGRQAMPPAAQSQQAGVHMYGGDRFDKSELPRFDGNDAKYLVFRRAFQDRTDRPDLSDDRKCNLLSSPDILTNDKIMNA